MAGIKGKVLDDPIPQNKYELQVVGAPPIVFTSVGSLEEELVKATMPDRRNVSGGETNPVEVDVTQPMHHKAEVAFMEGWYTGAQTQVTGYKMAGVLIYSSGSGQIIQSYTLEGVFPFKRVIGEVGFDNDGEMQNIVWSLSIDNILPNP